MTAQFYPVGITLDLSSQFPKTAADIFRLTPNATSTVVPVSGATTSSKFLGAPCPVTPDAANDVATTSYAMSTGEFIVTHANNPGTDREFSFVILL